MYSEKIEVADIVEIFDLVQQSSACHLKYATMLKNAMENQSDDQLLRRVCRCLKHAFLTNYKERNIYLERIITFTALFAVSFKSTENDPDYVHPTLQSIFRFILNLSWSSNDSHRYWACHLFNKIFKELEELSGQWYEQVTEAMMERLRDGLSAIRYQAVIALHRLQDPTDEKDPIISRLCSLLDTDFHSRVRQLCIEKIALNKHVIPFVMNRIRDVNADVRLAAFQKVHPIAIYLKVPQKRIVLQCGFNDSSEKIRKYTSTTLVESWLHSYKNDYLKLMKSIRLDACEEDVVTTTQLVELVLKALFKSASLESIISCIKVNEQKFIKYENLNWESVLYYRIAVEFLRQSDGFEDTLNAVLPELVYFCQYIKGYCEFTKNNEHFDELEYHFILSQFFMITRDYDVGDNSSRQCLNSLVHWMLQNEDLPPKTAQIIIRNLVKTIPNVTNRSIFVCEIISNIMYGEEAIDYEEVATKERERSHAISQLQSDIISLQDQENHFVHVEQNFVEAERVKREAEEKKSNLIRLKTVQDKPEQVEKKTDVTTMSKCLSIAEALLRCPTIREFNPAIATLNSELVNQALVHDDNGVKIKALTCYALCCIINHETARYGIHLFAGVLFANVFEDNRGLLISLKTVVDILSLYGLAVVEKSDDDEDETLASQREEDKKVFVGGTSLTDLIQAMARHLNHEDPQVQDTATKCVCILLLRNRVTSPSLLSRIILKWANPATDNEKLKQFIGLTLNRLTQSPKCHKYFGDAVISTIQVLVRAPQRSPLADVDIDNIVKFMVVLCQMSSQGARIHTDLALKMCYLMRDKPRAKVNFFFSKTLSLLTVPENGDHDELLAICDELRDVIRDNATLKNVNKFIANLTKKSAKLVSIKEE